MVTGPLPIPDVGVPNQVTFGSITCDNIEEKKYPKQKICIVTAGTCDADGG